MRQLNHWDHLPDSLLMDCIPCTLLDHDNHDPLLGISKQSLLLVIDTSRYLVQLLVPVGLFAPVIPHMLLTYLSRDDLFSAPKTSQSLSNSDLGHLWHSSDSNCLRVLETLWSTSYSKPLPAVPNATACSFHSDGCSETSTSSEGNPETSLDSAPSDLNSAPMLFGDSPSRNRVRVTPAASDIKGQVIKVIRDVKGQWWSGLMGNARRWP